MSRRNVVAGLGVGLVAAVGAGAAGIAVASSASEQVLSEDRGACAQTRVRVFSEEFSTACWEDAKAFPSQAVSAAIIDSGALDAGAVAYADAQKMPDYAVFSPEGTPCLDVVAVSAGARDRWEGRAAQRAADALAAWDGLPAENRCGGGA